MRVKYFSDYRREYQDAHVILVAADAYLVGIEVKAIGGDRPSFRTAELRIQGAAAMSVANLVRQIILGGVDLPVHPVAKKPDNPYSDRIGVGRTANNDISIVASDISKYHGYFCRMNESFEFVDAGSKNGTWIGSRRILPNAPTAVGPWDEVAFGANRFTFVVAREFEALLKMS